MPIIDLQSLIEKLGDVPKRALEASAGAALSRSHYNVEVEHWLLALVERDRSDVALLTDATEIGRSRLAAGLRAALDRFATGNGKAPGLAPDLVGIVKDAWLLASVEQGLTRIRSGALLWAALADESVGARLRASVPGLRGLVPDAIRRDLAGQTAGSIEDAAPAEASTLTGGAAPAGGGALDRYTIDLTARARAGRIDPILERNEEIRQTIDILTRRRQNNPILTGEAGVGKTAIVEGLALRIAAGDVPAALAQTAVRTLDLGLLQAGAGIKGEFENRLREAIDAVERSATPVVLFIDEAHTLIGAGGAAGQGDAANLLKPALARGELRVIAATTWAEYKKYFEKDAALARRFQPVKIEEPGEAQACSMLRGLVPVLESHHGVRILDEAVEAAVRLSARYIQGRQLPDKAVSLLDTACARVGLSQAATPPALEDRRRSLDAIQMQMSALEREQAGGADHRARIGELADQAVSLRDETASLTTRWHEERKLAGELAALRALAEGAEHGQIGHGQVGHGDDGQASLASLREVAARLAAMQGERPMVFPLVDTQAVAAIVESWTGVPAGRMRKGEIEAILDLPAALRRRVVGQDHALDAVARAVRTSRAGLTDPRKPVGVFLMVGTSGVGKTETALALADLLYGGEDHLTTINMSEFKEEHKVSLLMGSPPGYVGYGEGGVLTEAVRRRPHSVLLLDEIEKAHPGVQEVFFQVFDKGTMRDGEGRDVDFRNTVIIMTSNAGSDLIDRLFADPQTAPDAAGLAEALRPELLRHFKAAFLGRTTIVPYLPLSPAIMREIVELQFAKIGRRLASHFGARCEVSEAARDAVIGHASDAATGARSIETFLATHILADLSSRILACTAAGETVAAVTIDADAQGAIVCTVASKEMFDGR